MSVDRSSRIELHVRETVRLDRLQPTADGYVAAQYGALLTPGGTQVPPEAGPYHLRMLDDSQLRVLAGGVQVTSISTANDKDGGPIELLTNTAGVAVSAVWVTVNAKGHGPCGHVPALRVTYAAAGAS
jgi:hypothetical protein